MSEVISHHDPVIIDAVARFQQTRNAPSVIGGDIDIKIMRANLNEQPADFFRYAKTLNPNLVDLIDAEIGSGIESYMPVTKQDDEDSMAIHGVFQIKSQPEPRLIVPTTVVENARNWLGPLFHAAEVDEDIHTEAAITVAAWTALAGWVFDHADPTAHPDFQPYSKKYIDLARMTHISPEELDNVALSETRIADTLSVLRYRFMGSMAYAGLMQGIEDGEVSKFGVSRTAINMFRGTYSAMFAEHARQHPESVTPLYFAAAFPLTLRESKDMLSVLLDE